MNQRTTDATTSKSTTTTRLSTPRSTDLDRTLNPYAGHLLARRSVGRRARHPWQIGWRGWRDIAIRVGDAIIVDRVMLVAGGVTFYALLSMFPAISAAVSIYGLAADQATVANQFGLLRSALPDVGLQAIERELTALVSQQTGELGLAFGISLAIALWTANAAMKSLFEAMNIAYRETERRSFVRLSLVSLVFTLTSIVVFGILSTVVIALPATIGYLNLGRATEQIVRLGSATVMVLLAAVVVSALYRFGPCRRHARLAWIVPGVLIALIGASVASSAFSWYVANFANYAQTYGSLGALVGFLTWIWVMAMVVLIGAQTNAESERQTLRDSTVGAPRALGDRGAQVADTIGRSYSSPASLGRDEAPDPDSLPGIDWYTRLWLMLPLAAAWTLRSAQQPPTGRDGQLPPDSMARKAP